VGAGLASKLAGSRSVALAEFGDGAANQGTFHEALNMAGVWKLPCVFVCQDNNYGISVNKQSSTAIGSNADRAASYGIPGVAIDTNDADRVFDAVGEAVERARSGGGSTLIEVKVDRFYGHFQGDPETYRPKGEVEMLKRDDALKAYEARLKEQQVLTDDLVTEIAARVKAKVDEALTFARESDYPVADEAFQHVFAS